MKREAKELLLLEYKNCIDGYQYRDILVQDEFFKLVQLFSIFLTILLGLNVFTTINSLAYYIIISTIGLVGGTSMLALLIDMQSSISCKNALRKRCREIEAQIGHNNILTYWKSLRQRPKFLEEKYYKHLTKKATMYSNIFIITTRVILVLWVFIVVLLVNYKLQSIVTPQSLSAPETNNSINLDTSLNGKAKAVHSNASVHGAKHVYADTINSKVLVNDSSNVEVTKSNKTDSFKKLKKSK